MLDYVCVSTYYYVTVTMIELLEDCQLTSNSDESFMVDLQRYILVGLDTRLLPDY